jgi:hypothetical protein
MYRSFEIDDHERFLERQKQRATDTPKTLASFLFSPLPLSQPDTSEMSELVRWPAGGRPEEQRRSWACSPAGDGHPRVSASPSSGFAAVPLDVAHAHNPRVIAGDRHCSRITFPDFDGVGSGDGMPR